MDANKFQVRHRELFVALSCVAVGAVVGAFAYPLQRFEIWRQDEPSIFGQEYKKIFVLTESDKKLPYGLDRSQARKVATVYNDAKNQKLLLLVTGILSASAALAVGADTVENAEIEGEAKKLNAAAKKELILEQIKHKWAMASEAQKQLYRQEYRELVELFGEETQEADELNETDKFTNAWYMLQEGHSIDSVVSQTWKVKEGSEEFERLKQAFQEWIENDD